MKRKPTSSAPSKPPKPMTPAVASASDWRNNVPTNKPVDPFLPCVDAKSSNPRSLEVLEHLQERRPSALAARSAHGKFTMNGITQRVGQRRAHSIAFVQLGKRLAAWIRFPNHLLEIFGQFPASRIDREAALASRVHLLGRNAGFDQTIRSLRSCGSKTGSMGYAGPVDCTIQETRADANSHLASGIETSETKQVGGRFRKRKSQESVDEQGD